MKHPLLLASLLSLASPQLASAASADPVAFFDAAKMEFPESIAIDKAGNCYLSMVATGVVKKVTPAGVQSIYATIKDEFIVGLAFDGADNLFVVGGSGIWKVTPAGVVSLFSAIPGGAINDLAIAPDGYIYTTYQGDEKSGSLWRVDSNGVAKLWCTSPLFAPAASFMPAPVGINGACGNGPLIALMIEGPNASPGKSLIMSAPASIASITPRIVIAPGITGIW